jgi:hypothetical protein
MKRIRPILNLALPALLAAWAFAGCDHATDTDLSNDVSGREQTVNLDDPYGGFNTADEAPAFAESLLTNRYGPETDVAVNDDVDTTRVDRRRPHRFLMVTWGNLRADSLIDFSTDWTGSLCVENGIVVVRRTIQFEPRDYLLPRTSRQCVEWVSHTQPRFDGLIVALLKPPCFDSLSTSIAGIDSLCGDPLTVTFKTGPLTVTFTQEELANLHKVIPVDDAGNAVAFNTLLVMPGQCPQGFLAGQWKDVEDKRYQGVFRGKWVSENGVHMGYLRGVYGENSEGRHVFFGKWITQSGRFQGLLKGGYGVLPSPNAREADGWFEGVWFSRELRAMGGLKGVWGTGQENRDCGYFRGVWMTRCPRVTS